VLTVDRDVVLAPWTDAADERYFTVYNKYTSSLPGAAPTGLGFGSATSEHGYYSIAVDGLGANNSSYTLTATPLGVQGADVCLNLALDNLGQKIYSGNLSNGNCW
jgi:Tfp pilus assembly protein PilE